MNRFSFCLLFGTSFFLFHAKGFSQDPVEDAFAHSFPNSANQQLASVNKDSIQGTLQQLNERASDLIEKDPDSAFSLALTIQKMAETYGEKQAAQKALFTQYIVQKRLGNDSLAYINLEAAAKVKKEIADSANELSFESIRRKFNIEQREQEINLLKTRKEIQSLQFQRNKMVVSIALPSFIALIILSFVFWKQHIRKKSLQITLQDHHVKIKGLNNELKSINNELIASELSLKQVNDTKNKFFSLVSQDLKSPLNSLSAFLRDFIEGSAASKESNADAFVKRVNESVTNLSSLIHNLLEWSRLQMGSMEYLPERLDLKDTVAENVILINPQSKNKEIEIVSTITAGTMVFVDKRMIGFVFRNLISQLLNVSKEGAIITITATNDFENKTVHVTLLSDDLEDNENELLQSWEINAVYLKSPESIRNRGLGLVLCREFIEKHKGSIILSGEERDRNSINFTLPLS